MSTDAEPTPDAPFPEPPTVDPLQERIAQLEEQVGNYKLLIAEFENSRKRLIQDAERQRKYAQEPLARELLTAFDNLDRAVAAAKQAGDEGPLAQGVTATIQVFLDAFKRNGVTKIDAAPGTPFDPARHDAVMEQPTNDFEPGSIVQVLQHGFLLHDRVIRPSTVIVAKEPPAGS